MFESDDLHSKSCGATFSSGSGQEVWFWKACLGVPVYGLLFKAKLSCLLFFFSTQALNMSFKTCDT